MYVDGGVTPQNGTEVVLKSRPECTTREFYFSFNEDAREIRHVSGKILRPQGGSTCPQDGTFCVLHDDQHEAAKFYFGDRSQAKLDHVRRYRPT